MVSRSVEPKHLNVDQYLLLLGIGIALLNNHDFLRSESDRQPKQNEIENIQKLINGLLDSNHATQYHNMSLGEHGEVAQQIKSLLANLSTQDQIEIINNNIHSSEFVPDRFNKMEMLYLDPSIAMIAYFGEKYINKESEKITVYDIIIYYSLLEFLNHYQLNLSESDAGFLDITSESITQDLNNLQTLVSSGVISVNMKPDQVFMLEDDDLAKLTDSNKREEVVKSFDALKERLKDSDLRVQIQSSLKTINEHYDLIRYVKTHQKLIPGPESMVLKFLKQATSLILSTIIVFPPFVLFGGLLLLGVALLSLPYLVLGLTSPFYSNFMDMVDKEMKSPEKKLSLESFRKTSRVRVSSEVAAVLRFFIKQFGSLLSSLRKTFSLTDFIEDVAYAFKSLEVRELSKLRFFDQKNVNQINVPVNVSGDKSDSLQPSNSQKITV